MDWGVRLCFRKTVSHFGSWKQRVKAEGGGGGSDRALVSIEDRDSMFGVARKKDSRHRERQGITNDDGISQRSKQEETKMYSKKRRKKKIRER